MSKIDWHARAAALSIDGRALIDGRRVDSADGGTFACMSPVDGRKLADVARCRAADIDRAVAAARAAFADRRWAGMSPGERKRALIRFADLVLANREELALLETLDMGRLHDRRHLPGSAVPGTRDADRAHRPGVRPIYRSRHRPEVLRDPGAVRWSATWDEGSHNEDVYGGLLGLSTDEIASLKEEGVL